MRRAPPTWATRFRAFFSSLQDSRPRGAMLSAGAAAGVLADAQCAACTASEVNLPRPRRSVPMG
jgi:hypothetical protein